MCRVATIALPLHRQASAVARRFLGVHLQLWQVPPDEVDRALLLASEAVSNAVVHAGTPSTLTVALVGECLEIGVADLSTHRPIKRPVAQAEGHRAAETRRLLDEHGRGMLLIDALADAWKVQDLPDGKQVWFRFQIARSPQDTSACACQDDAVEPVMLASGARVVDMLAR